MYVVVVRIVQICGSMIGGGREEREIIVPEVSA
jgi:hypothetical protein